MRQVNAEIVKSWNLGGSQEEWDHYANVVLPHGRNVIPPEINFESLCEITKLFDKHQIDYQVAYGTLLGLVRDGKLIEGDTDVDIYVPVKHCDQVRSLTRDHGFMKMVINMATESWCHCFFKVRSIIKPCLKLKMLTEKLTLI
jgi:hypothetical protein